MVAWHRLQTKKNMNLMTRRKCEETLAKAIEAILEAYFQDYKIAYNDDATIIIIPWSERNS